MRFSYASASSLCGLCKESDLYPKAVEQTISSVALLTTKVIREGKQEEDTAETYSTRTSEIPSRVPGVP